MASLYDSIVVDEFGGPDVLKVRSKRLDTLTVGKGQILVKVYAAGINPVETYQRSGNYARLPPLPFTPGKECSGVVAEVGEEVTRFKRGDRVFVYLTATGAYSQYAVVDEEKADILPHGVSFAQGAAIGTAYRTAFRALIHKAKARPGMTILVHGASGGVGVATSQLAVSYGMTVIGTAGTLDGLEMIRSMGCAAALNHRERGYLDAVKDLTNGRGVDVVIEMLANVNLDADLSILARGGVVCIVGNRGTIEINPRDLMMKESSIVGVLGWGTEEEQRESRTAIVNGLQNGKISPIVGMSYELRHCPAAHVEVIEHRKGTQGKIVLLPWDGYVKAKL